MYVIEITSKVIYTKRSTKKIRVRESMLCVGRIMRQGIYYSRAYYSTRGGKVGSGGGKRSIFKAVGGIPLISLVCA